MKGKVLILKGESLYNVLRIAADRMAEAFQDNGYSVTVLDMTIKEEQPRFLALLEEKLDLIFSFQALFFEQCLGDGKTSFYSLLRDTAVFGHIVDHPIYHSTRVETTHGDNMYVGCIDRCHVEYINRFYPGVKNALFLPHGGFEPQSVVPYEQRSIDLYFPSSYNNPEKVRDKINELPEVYQNIANLLITRMLEDPLLTMQDALYTYLKQVNFTYTSEEFTQLMSILGVVDEYIHEYSRDQCVRSLVKNGVKITVSGSGWDKFDPELLPNINVISSTGVDFTRVLELMADSKLVLNHVPTLQNGMHERIFTSMLCGAICLTNDFPIMHEEFSDGDNVILYSESKLELFAERIKELLASPEQSKQIASNGQKLAQQSHTWAKNAKTILEIVGLE